MKILVINLDRTPDRMERMTSILAEQDLEPVRVSAVDGRTLSEEERARWMGAGRIPTSKKRQSLGLGEVACFLSHRKCWEMVLKGSDTHAVILEDDIYIGACEEVMASPDWIPADADVVKLETNAKRTILDSKPEVTIGGRHVRRLYGLHNGTAGYVVSREAARKLLDMSQTFSVTVDWFMFNPECESFHALTIYQVDPAVCIQDQNLNRKPSSEMLDSTLREERLRRRRVGLSKLRREIVRPFIKFARILRGIVPSQKAKIVPFQ